MVAARRDEPQGKADCAGDVGCRNTRQQGTRDISGRSRRIVGWTIAIVIVGFFVAAFAGWIDVLPG